MVFLFSCSSNRQEFKQDSESIIYNEIKRHSSFYQNQLVVVDFNLDDFLGSYITKHSTDSIKKRFSLSRKLSDREINMIFNEEEANYLTEKLMNTQIVITDEDLSENLIFRKKTIKSTQTDENYILLSHPAITKDRNFALIAFATGKMNSMNGGVNVYLQSNGEWKFYKSIEMWMN